MERAKTILTDVSFGREREKEKELRQEKNPYSSVDF